MTKEMLEKAMAAKSVEELLALARENNVELTEEQAKKVFDQLCGSGELADDDLENVAGGLRYPDTYYNDPVARGQYIRKYNEYLAQQKKC